MINTALVSETTEKRLKCRVKKMEIEITLSLLTKVINGCGGDVLPALAYLCLGWVDGQTAALTAVPGALTSQDGADWNGQLLPSSHTYFIQPCVFIRVSCPLSERGRSSQSVSFYRELVQYYSLHCGEVF